MEDYYQFDIDNATKMGAYLDRKEREFIDSFLLNNNINNCLDVACGSGRFSIPMSQRQIDVIAADADLAALKILKSKNIDSGIDIFRLDAHKLPFKKSSFDCIVSIQTVDFLDVNNFFKECNRVLKKDGVFLFIATNNHSYKKYIYKILRKNRIFYRYSFQDIISYLENNGFKVEKYIGYNWIPFKRDSNSVLITVFEFLEKISMLKYVPVISPWVFFVAKKR